MLYYKQVVRRGKTAEEKAVELDSHLDVSAFFFYFDKFAKDCVRTSKPFDVSYIMNEMFERFVRNVNVEYVLQQDTNVRLSDRNLNEPIRDMESLFDKCKFNEESKFWMLRQPLFNIPSSSNLQCLAVWIHSRNPKSLSMISISVLSLSLEHNHLVVSPSPRKYLKISVVQP